MGVKTLFSNGEVIDRFHVNNIISLHSMKDMFGNDLKVVQEYLFNKFPKVYNNIAITHEKKTFDHNGYR